MAKPSECARPAGLILPLRGTPLRATVGVAIALLQALFLADTVHLQTHGHGHDVVADLPAEYHHHDYKIVQNQDLELVDAEECLGCRLERTPGLPTLGTTDVVLATRSARGVTVAPPYTALSVDRSRLPRAPPHA